MSIKICIILIFFSDSANNQAKVIADLEAQISSETKRFAILEEKFNQLQSSSAADKREMEDTVSALQDGNSDLSTQLEAKRLLLEDLSSKNAELERSASDLTDQLASTNFQLTKAQR